MAYLERHLPNVEFQQNITNSEPKRTLSSAAGMKTMLLQMTEHP